MVIVKKQTPRKTKNRSNCCTWLVGCTFSKERILSTEVNVGNLRKSSIGVTGIVFFVVAAAAPLAAIVGAGPVVFAAGGEGAPGLYLIASIVLLLFAVGFAAMSRYVTSAGGFAATVSRGLGNRLGYATAGVAIVAYAGMLIGLYGQFAIFLSDLLKNFFGLDINWFILAATGVIVVGILSYLDVNLSAAVLGVLMIAEVLLLLIFDVSVLAQGGSSGINIDNFSPSNVFSPGIGIGMLFAFACFVGFEATTIYGEEAKNPKKTVAIATYVSIGLIGFFYVLTTWAVGLAYGSGNASAAAAEDPVGFVLNANTQFVGQWSTDVMQVLIVTSVFAVLLSFQNTLSRYFFSLGRSGLLPSALGKTHPKFKSPYIAGVFLTVLSLVVLGIFAIAGADPFMNVYLWLVGLGTLGVLVLQALGAIAVVGYFAKEKKVNVWVGAIAPGLGAIGLIFAIYLAVTNFSQLTAVNEGPVTLLPWLIIVFGLVMLIIGVSRSRKKLVDLGIDHDS